MTAFSRATRMNRASSAWSRSMSETIDLFCGVTLMRPSSASLMNASRTGVLLTPSASETSFSLIR